MKKKRYREKACYRSKKEELEKQTQKFKKKKKKRKERKKQRKRKDCQTWATTPHHPVCLPFIHLGEVTTASGDVKAKLSHCLHFLALVHILLSPGLLLGKLCILQMQPFKVKKKTKKDRRSLLC